MTGNLVENERGSSPRQRIIPALIWFVVFCLWFYSFGLPNNQPLFDAYIYGDSPNHAPAQRWMAWPLVPFQLLDLVDPPIDNDGAPWSWSNLFQRLPFIGIAAFVWACSLGIGRLTLRGFRLHTLLDRAERLFFAGCLGLAEVSLMMLGLGLLGILGRWPITILLMGMALFEVWLSWHDPLRQQDRTLTTKSAGKSTLAVDATSRSSRLGWLVIGIVAPFVFCMWLGAMSPQVDFDVIEYHLGGPKEWYRQGQITRLPHNVYTSFPCLTEMLLLTGMVIYGDWDWGALAGQAILAGFAPLTAIGLFATGRRWFSSSAGALAALVWLTTPWVYRISIIAYAEGGLACYLFSAFAMSLRLVWDGDRSDNNEATPNARPSMSGTENSQQAGLPFTCGLLSGCAMSCKYTGLLSVVLPVGLLVACSIWRSATKPNRLRKMALIGGLFGAGVLLAVGPWLLKNLVETGNPVFPLAYNLFGGSGRDAIMDAQWRSGHSRHYSGPVEILSDLPVKLSDVVANNDWHSALMFGLAPIALLASWRKKVWVLWSIVGWQFLSWFLFTHQIDRFYVPMFPIVALLAGCAANWLTSSSQAGAWVGGTLIAANIFFNAWMMEQQRMSGFNAGRMDLQAVSRIAVSPSLDWINTEYAAGRLPRNTNILCVGEAALFHARFPYVYNTVFDRSLFEKWFGERTESGGFRLRPTDEIRATLREKGITHVLVNWMEILRYREPGSYGYTDFAHPDRFEELKAAGVLGVPLSLPDRASFVPVDEKKRKQIEQWAPKLGISLGDHPGCRAVQVFPVRP